MRVLVAEQCGLQDLGLGKGVWGMVRGLTAMWELKASKVSSSVIVTVWLAQIGRAAVSAWLPCSSLHHGTEQSCTSAPTHQTRSGTHTVLSSHRFAHADTRPRLRWFGGWAQQFDYKLCAVRHRSGTALTPVTGFHVVAEWCTYYIYRLIYTYIPKPFSHNIESGNLF